MLMFSSLPWRLFLFSLLSFWLISTPKKTSRKIPYSNLMHTQLLFSALLFTPSSQPIFFFPPHTLCVLFPISASLPNFVTRACCMSFVSLSVNGLMLYVRTAMQLVNMLHTVPSQSRSSSPSLKFVGIWSLSYKCHAVSYHIPQ